MAQKRRAVVVCVSTGKSPRSMLLRLLVLLALVAGTASAQDADCVPVAPGSATIRCNIPIAADTLLYLENQGVARLFVDLNGNDFKLAADPDEVARSGNAFPIPREGAITINIAEYMLDDDNVIEFTPQGPAGSTVPRIVIANVLLTGQTVAYALEGLRRFPQELDLFQSYPNPFRSSTTLTYTIPEDRITGLPVRLFLYDIAGRLVRVLVNDRRYPGTFTVLWDGRTASGAPAASGVYLAHLVAGDLQQSIRLVRLR